ncbi:MAG: phosphatidylinositol-specific phospholipase C domain-containing protein [Clostridia bacterium]|nr:phosphatidylinositol-specific phospholipase C domain-containing protein [Clostridia bacterium]
MISLLKRAGRKILRTILCLTVLYICVCAPAVPGSAKAEIDTAEWMKYLPDVMQISQINLPGTHDSGCFYMWSDIGKMTARTQSWTIRGQLDHGIRNFDIRLGDHGDDKYDMKLCHGVYDCYEEFECKTKLTLDSVLKTVEAFLQEHPSETVVLMIREEKGGETVNRKIEQIMQELHHDGKGNSKYPHCVSYNTCETVPWLRDVRGKAVILCKKTWDESKKKYSDNLSYTDWATDYHWGGDEKTGSDTSPKLKKETIEKYLKRVSEWPQKYYWGIIDTFMDTGANLKTVLNNNEPLPTISAPALVSTNLTALPTAALWKGPDHCWYKLYDAEGFKDVSLYTKNMRTGWWQFDFPTEDHIRQIIRSNLTDICEYVLHIDLTGVPESIINIDRFEVVFTAGSAKTGNAEITQFNPWVKNTAAENEYYTYFGKFPLGDINLDTLRFGHSGHLMSREYVPVLKYRSEKDQGDGITVINDYFEFVPVDTPVQAEISVEWENRLDYDQRPADLEGFMRLIGNGFTFIATDSAGNRRTIPVPGTAGTSITDYILTQQYDSSHMWVNQLPGSDGLGGRLTYTGLQLSDTSEDYDISVTKDVSSHYTIHMKYKKTEDVSDVEINVSWHDGNDEYGLRHSLLEYLMGTGENKYDLFANYSAGNRSGTVAGVPLLGVVSYDKGERFIFTVNEKASGNLLTRHKINNPEINGERGVKPDYHYTAVSKTILYEPSVYPRPAEKNQFTTFTDMYLMGTCDVKVNWVGDTPDDRPENGIIVYLPGDHGDPVEIGPQKGSTWVKKDNALQIYDKDNNKLACTDETVLVWTHEADPPEGYRISVSMSEKLNERGKAPHYEITITMMKPSYTDIRGRVEWRDGDRDLPHEPPGISVIQQYMIDPEKGMTEDNIAEIFIPAGELRIIWDGNSYRFDDITRFPAYMENGSPCTYLIGAEDLENYSKTVTGWNVRYERMITLSGSVDWKDRTRRPSAVQPTVTVIRNDQPVGLPVREENFTYCVKDLPLADENNVPYRYTIIAELEGYEKGKDISIIYGEPEEGSDPGDVRIDAVILFCSAELPIGVPVELTLINSDPAAEPDSFFFLLEGETPEGDYQSILTLNSENAFTDRYVLDGSLFADDTDYVFTVRQMSGAKPNWDYDEHTADVTLRITDINGKRTAQVDMSGDTAVRFTNTRLDDTESIMVTARWNDAGRNESVRPVSTGIRLLGDGKEVRNAALSGSEGWVYTFEDLPLYREELPRTAVEYTLAAEAPDGYRAEIAGDPATGFTVTYTAMISVSGSVDWENGKRPANNQPGVQLLRNGQPYGDPVQEEDFTYIFEGLPIADANNTAYEYSIIASLDGFDATFSYLPAATDVITGDVTLNALIRLNSRQSDVEVPVQLTLVNSDPAAETEVFSFLLEGENREGEYRKILRLDKDCSFEGAFMLDGSLFEDGKDYPFTVKQIPGTKVNWDYDSHTAAITIRMVWLNGVRTARVDMGGGTAVRFTNTRLNDVRDIMVTARWIDAGRDEAARPGLTEIRLLGDGKKVRNAELKCSAGWIYTFDALPVYRSTLPRAAVDYTLAADAPDGYTAEVTGDAASGFTVTYTAMIPVSGSVDWENGKRPANNQPLVQLLRNGRMIGMPVQETDFTYSFDDLPIADMNNVPYEYSIAAELKGFDVTFIYAPVVKDPVTGNVTADAVIRRNSGQLNAEVPVQLTLVNSDPAAEPETFFFLMEGDDRDGRYQAILELDSENAFAGRYVLDGDLFEDGKDYHFTVKQMPGTKPVWNYDSRTADVVIRTVWLNGVRTVQVDMGGDTAVRFTNTRLTDTENITVTARWIDAGRDEATRPGLTEIRLFGDGREAAAADLERSAGWTYRFTDLPLYRSTLPRAAIDYTLTADAPDGYTAEVTGDTTRGFTVTYTAMIPVSGSVDWENGKRPANDQPMVQLLRNGQMIGMPVQETDFAYSFDSLPIADMNNVPYEYSILADLDGFDVVMRYLPVKRDPWTGNITADAVMSINEEPVQAEVPVELKLSGIDQTVVTDSFTFVMESKEQSLQVRVPVVLNRENGFTDSFRLDASSFEPGRPYVFTVRQLTDGPEYWVCDERIATVTVTIVYINGKPAARVTSDAQGLTFTNVYRPVSGMVSIETEKRIINLLEGIAVPDSRDFRFELFSVQPDGELRKISTAGLTGEGRTRFPEIMLTEAGEYLFAVRETDESVTGWAYDGTTAAVRVRVTDVNGYLHTETDNVPVFSNVFETPVRDISVKVRWVDDNRQKRPVPDSVGIYLAADGVRVSGANAGPGTVWCCTFADMPEYRKADMTNSPKMIPVRYTVTGENIPNFTCSVSGDIKNGFVVTYTANRIVPPTGDTADPVPAACIFITSMAVLAVLLRKRRRS